MSAYIKGKIQKGIGESSNTVKEQMPFFEKCFPEVTCCKAATINILLASVSLLIYQVTINILLEQPLVVLSPDFTTEPLPWHPAFKMVKGGEVFKFLRIKLQVAGFDEVNAWIYKAQFSPYQDNPYYIEVLAPKINFVGTPDCKVTVLGNCKEGYVVMGESKRTLS